MTAHAHISDLTPEERAGFVWPMTDDLWMEAAMVLWEAFMDIECSENLMFPGRFGIHRDMVGTIQTRHDLMPMVGPLHIGWHVHQLAAGDDLMVPFDWEFAPWFLRNCVEVETSARSSAITLKTGWLDQCRAARGQG